ncbi:MAG: hypothetical protein WAT74_00085 [Flavobacteriales bacterium]
MPKKLSTEEAAQFEANSRMLLAVIEYEIELGECASIDDKSLKDHWKGVYEIAKDAVANCRIGRVNQWLREMTEEREHEVALIRFVCDRTGLELRIRERLLTRIKRITDRGRITSDSQFYDVMNEIDFLYQSTQPDRQRIELLNALARSYEQHGANQKND